MILLTGSNGFIGAAIAKQIGVGNYMSLNRIGANFCFDLSNEIPLFEEQFDAVIHSAGKAHSVPKTKEEVDLFFSINYQGTINLLKALEQKPPKAFVYISTVAVYGLTSGIDINENTPLLATDPYGKSKLMAEEYITEWAQKKNISLLIFRLPLVVGKNAPGNLKDMIKAIKKGYYFNIGRGNVRKSMVMINDVAQIVVRSLGKTGIYNLTDGYHPSFKELSALISKEVNKHQPLDMPFVVAKFLGLFGDILGEIFPLNSQKLKKITSELVFDDTKARAILNWEPSPVLHTFKVE